MSFQIGDKIGDYQIIGVLGAGGMGRVYKVKNLISDRIDAMKVLLPDLANEPESGRPLCSRNQGAGKSESSQHCRAPHSFSPGKSTPDDHGVRGGHYA